MAEYIDRQELLKNLNKFAPEHYSALVNTIITKQPAADVVEVKHGHWKLLPAQPVTGTLNVEAECSNCGREVVYQIVNNRYEFENFCPHCGAKMDGDTDEE